MSIEKEALEKLGKLVDTDEAFAEQLKGAVEAKDADAVVALASQRGVQVDAADLAPFFASSLEGAELDESELAAVAGGKAPDADTIARLLDEKCGYWNAFTCGLIAAQALNIGVGQ